MKNVLLCGLNSVAIRAPRLSAADPRATAFASYVSNMLNVILTHLEGKIRCCCERIVMFNSNAVDRYFFTTPLENGLVLASVFGPDCTPNATSVCDKIARARDSLKGPFDGKALVAKLDGFAGELRALWQRQIAAINVKALSARQTDTEVRNATRSTFFVLVALHNRQLTSP